jgi:hypothetical protein
MIEAEFVFGWGEAERAVSALLSLTSPIRPTRFSGTEVIEDERDIVDDSQRLCAFLTNRNSGFFLTGDHATYHFRVVPTRDVTCNCFFEVDETLVQEFAECMAKASPIYGYSCYPEERKWRNRLSVKLKNLQMLETWVGRDPRKYIPGLYWLTVISEELAQQHHISLTDIACDAEFICNYGSITLFLFFQHPEDWLQYRERIDKLCTKYRGIFSLNRIRALLEGESNFLELNALLSNWS